jgi:uncharacterized protein YndB with AHSA1/START domain
MTDNTVPAVPEITETDVYITRAFNAPREIVWRFFTEPELLTRWFGPAGIHIDPESVQIQLHPGGSWNLDMVDDGTDEHFPMRVKLTVVTPPEYLEGVEDTPPGFGPDERIRLRIWFHDHGDKTRITLHQGPFTPEFRDMTLDGWESSFVKMDAVIEAGVA